MQSNRFLLEVVYKLNLLDYFFTTLNIKVKIIMRAYNFSAGPAILPEEVLEEVQSELLDYKNSGMSIMEVSHRGKEYSAIHEETISNIKELLNQR